MSFSIGGFLSALGSIAAPIIGGIVGGPAGFALGSAVSAGFGAPSSSVGPTVLTLRGPPRGRPVTTGGGGATTLPGAGGVLSLALGAGRLIASLLARASATLGKRINRAGVLSLTREVGIVAAATALGLTAVEIAQIIASKPRRRRRGITAAQLTTTKATIRRMDSINRAIAQVCPPASRRRRPSRAAIHHAK